MWLEAETIEALDTGWLFDHFYPIFPDASEGPCFEGWTALSYLAGRTERLRLGLLVTGNPYRHPAVLANMAATFDIFSGGRLELGLGAGWNEQESGAYGIELLPIGQRMDQFEEACEVIHLLLTQPAVTFEGHHYRLEDARCEPKPVQRPRPPIVIGGQGDVGRDPNEITLSLQHTCGPDPVESAAQIEPFVDAGADHVILYFDDNSDPKRLGQHVDAVISRIGLAS
jgi:alkanesulfonate monooxygenase SsuD/methylene tetrahydromethanopterin reductase-like flavin-dependent oxidoreductase (luciferase family)